MIYRRPIRLTPADLTYGIDLGRRRYFNAITRNLHNKLTPGRDPLACHINGAIAEVGAARVLDLALPAGLTQFHRQPDLLPDVEVRWTSDPNGALVIRDDDNLDRLFVHVTGYAPNLIVVGGIRGFAVLPEWRRNPGGYGEAWFVPPEAVLPITPYARTEAS
jgi:hypothetical protein